MPKKLTDKDRILNFAFRASSEELADAIAVLKAAHTAKVGGSSTRERKGASKRPARPTPAAATSATAGSDGQ